MSDSSSQPQKFGRFEVEGVIGRGGMGVVYRALDPVIGRPVAIKVLKVDHEVDDDAMSSLRTRFEQEFRSAGTLSHPSLVVIYDVGQEGDLTYIAMEMVEGPSLHRLLENDEPLNLDQVLTITYDIGQGLDHAHRAGIIHRDIKPGNILFGTDGRAKITDFGVAKVRSMDITMTGTLVGTPGYMAPEQILGKQVTGAADQFALASMAYQMLTGQMPFMAEQPATVLYKIAHAEPAPAHELNPSLSLALSQALGRGLAKAPEDRYESCTEFAKALRRAAGQDTSAFVPAELGSDALHKQAPFTPSDETRVAPSSVSEFKPSTLAPPTSPTTPMSGALGTAATNVAPGTGGSEGTDSGVILHRPAALRGGSKVRAPDSYGDADSWWQRQSSAGRWGTVLVVLAILGVGGWFLWQNLSNGQAVETTAGVDAEATDTGVESNDPNALPPEPKLFTVNTAPPGATVLLDGAELEQPTPVNLNLVPGETYDLRITLDGYYPLEQKGIDPDTLERQVLNFDLQPIPPPGEIAVSASYPVQIRINGRAVSGRPQLEAGSYQVQLDAPSVYYSETRRVQVKAGETTSIRLPATGSVRVVAIPGNAQVIVDGQESRALEPPDDLELVEDTSHTFQFVWPDGATVEREVVVGPAARQLIGTPDGIEVRGG